MKQYKTNLEQRKVMILNTIFLNFMLLSYQRSIKLYKMPEFSEYTEYCSSEYKRFEQNAPNLKLQKLIVFHRHGDRSPLEAQNTSWINEDCIKCSFKDKKISDCEIIKCTDGQLTKKGYQQLVDLGIFIKENYLDDLDGDIYLRSTNSDRTLASLNAVMKGLKKTDTIKHVDVRNEQDDSLLYPSSCPKIKERINHQVSDSFISFKTLDDTLGNTEPQRRADVYLTALCNDISIDCDKMSCDIELIKKYFEVSKDVWKKQSEALRADDNTLKTTFGVFINDLLTILNSNHKLNILSVHDSTLTMILMGLGTDVYDHPPYASALFVEIWGDDAEVDKNEKKHLRIIFNDKICSTIIERNDNISYEKFLDYLDVLKSSYKDKELECGIEKLEEKEQKT